MRQLYCDQCEEEVGEDEGTWWQDPPFPFFPVEEDEMAVTCADCTDKLRADARDLRNEVQDLWNDRAMLLSMVDTAFRKAMESDPGHRCVWRQALESVKDRLKKQSSDLLQVKGR